MPRRIRNTKLEKRTPRAELRPSRKPHWQKVAEGLHVGYRRPKQGAGKFLARYYVGGGQYQEEVLGTADDFADADGISFLSFSHAQLIAQKRLAERSPNAEGVKRNLFVRNVIEDYLSWLEINRKSAADARYRADAFILPELGAVKVNDLTTKRIRSFLHSLARQPARVRSKPAIQAFRPLLPTDHEAQRQRQASANRVFTVLRAALNHAWGDGAIGNDSAWRRVKPFKGVERSRSAYLTLIEAKRLISACEPSFRMLVRGALETGARYSELARLVVADFDAKAGTIAVRDSKSGRGRHVILTDDGRRFFLDLTSSRDRTNFIFVNGSGDCWKKSNQNRPMRTACTSAGIERIPFHQLRHTWASLAVMAGVPLQVVAENLGHRDTRMVERHYAHLSQSFMVHAIRSHAPRFAA